MPKTENVALDAHVLLDTDALRARLSESVCEECVRDTLPEDATEGDVADRIELVCLRASTEPDRVAAMLKEELSRVANAAELAGLMADAIDEVAMRLVRDYAGHGLLDATPVRVMATCTLQRWQYDYAVTVDEVSFDCRTALDRIGLDDLPDHVDDFKSEGACNYGDDVWFEAVRAGLVEDWDGPFEFYVTDDDAYEAYLRKRSKGTRGVDGE